MESDASNQSHWIPLADLMTGLMMVFMLLTAAFMLRVEQTTTLVVQDYVQVKSDMLQALQKEFAKDLKQWNAELLGDMTIRFNDPAVLFATGSSAVRPQFKEVLKDFFPRYVALLTTEKYKSSVKEIRLEGHTSAFWSTTTDEQTAYIRNMELSQARTRSVLEYLLTLSALKVDGFWLIEHLTANGLSSSKPIHQKITHPANQRVEFRIITNASDRMDQIAIDLKK